MKIEVALDTYAFMPMKAHKEDAGYDLKMPANIPEFVVPPHDGIFVDTGVRVSVPYGYEGKVEAKSGLYRNYGLITTGVVDCGYSGTIGVTITNTRDEAYIFHAGDKIAQLVFTKILQDEELVEVDHISSGTRGTGGFGSTGR